MIHEVIVMRVAGKVIKPAGYYDTSLNRVSMERNSFIFYKSFYEAIKDLPSDIKIEVFTAIAEYALYGKEPDNLKPFTKGMFALIRPNIDINNSRFENGKKGANYGKRGGRPKKAEISEKEEYSLTYEQEVDQMKSNKDLRKTFCEDFNIDDKEYESRLARFLEHCNNDKKYKAKERHNSLVDCQSHLRYWMTKAYASKQSPRTKYIPDDSIPFPDMTEALSGMDYEENDDIYGQ